MQAQATAVRSAAGPSWRPALRMAPHAASRSRLVVAGSMTNSRTASLRKLLRGPDMLLGPCCHDALSARLIERAGFPYAFMSGFCTAGARLGAPDTGLISYYEMMDQGRYINEATHSLPIIGDGDTGYGNAMNVKRTVKGYAQAGFAGILIEDQVAPKSCGHVRGKRVVSREEALARIRAAVDARDEGADILIVARTDARQAVSLEEALWRAQAFAEAGADVLFIDALESVEEMKRFCGLGGVAARVPKMANMLEGGGKTPVLPPSRLSSMGFKLVAYPLSLLGVSIRAMEGALEGLKRGVVPPPAALGNFADIQAAVGFPEYYAEEARYAVSSPTPGPMHAAPPPPPPSPAAAAPHMSVVEPEVLQEGDPSPNTTTTSGRRSAPSQDSFSWPLPEEPRPSPYSSSSSSAAPSSSSLTNMDQPKGGQDGSSSDPNYRRNRSLRVRISDRATGLVKLETRIPAGFLNGLQALVPQIANANIEALMEQAMGKGMPEPGQPLLNFNSGADNIQIFLE